MRPENYGQSDVDFAAVDALFRSGDPEAAELMASLGRKSCGDSWSCCSKCWI